MKECRLRFNVPFNNCWELPDNHCLVMRNEDVPEGNLEHLQSMLEGMSDDYLKATINLFGPGGHYDGWCVCAPIIYSTATSIDKKRVNKG